MPSMATGVIFINKCENTNSSTIFSHWLPFPLPGSKWRIIPNITECALNICKYVPIIIYVCASQRISTHPAPQAPKLWAIRNRRCCSGPHSRISILSQLKKEKNPIEEKKHFHHSRVVSGLPRAKGDSRKWIQELTQPPSEALS